MYFTSARGRLSDAEVYNMETNQWRKINSLIQGRVGSDMHVLNGKLTVFGGILNTGTTYTSMEEYDGLNWREVNTTLVKGFKFGASVVLSCTPL